MKMMNVLDMMGNQIQEFLVHNGSVKGQGAITANTGKMVYNEGDRSMYYGYDNSTDGKGGDLLWSRLVDVAHLGQALAEDSVYAWAKKISESSIEVDENTFSLSADTVKEMLRRGGEAYLWGNHEEQNYAKSFTARKYIRKDSDIYPDYRLTKNKLQEIAGPYPSLELVYDDTTQTIYMHVTADSWNGSEGIFELYFEEWDSVRGVPALESLYGEGYIMSIGDTGDVYTCTPYGATDWVKFGNKNSTEWTEEVRASVSAEGLVSAVNNANMVYAWGNHADAGYDNFIPYIGITNVGDVDAVMINDRLPEDSNPELVFSTNKGFIFRVVTLPDMGAPRVDYYDVKSDTHFGPETMESLHTLGKMISVDGSIYKFNGANGWFAHASWMLVHSGTNGGFSSELASLKADIDRIKAYFDSNASVDNKLNQWHEIVNFLDGFGESDKLLANVSSKLSWKNVSVNGVSLTGDSAVSIYAPTSLPSGDEFATEYGRYVPKVYSGVGGVKSVTLQRYKYVDSIVCQEDNTTKIFTFNTGISSEDVIVKVYRETGNALIGKRREEVLTDVTVVNTGGFAVVTVEFGSAPKSEVFKVVVIG